MFKCDNNNSKKKKKKTKSNLDNKSAVRKINVWPGKQEGMAFIRCIQAGFHSVMSS